MTDQSNDGGAGASASVVDGATAEKSVDAGAARSRRDPPDLASLLLAMVEKLGWRHDPAFAEFIDWADGERNPDRAA